MGDNGDYQVFGGCFAFIKGVLGRLNARESDALFHTPTRQQG